MILPKLGVNVDHVATLRQARYREGHARMTPEPDVLAAALVVQQAGAHGLTIHLREDRRHIQEADLTALRREISLPLNLEMAVSDAMVRLAVRTKPAEVCLVPENRREVTTEGGLDVAGCRDACVRAIARLAAAKISVSAFIDPERRQVEASHACGAGTIELHTGAYANARPSERRACLRRLREAATHGHSLGLTIHAGHGLTLANLPALLGEVPHLRTLNIGHSLISHAVFVGLGRAVRDFLAALGHRRKKAMARP
jgi:pyridoxine 5-phosphate synthase